MHPPSRFRQKALYSFGQFGNGVYNGVNTAILGLFVSAYTGNAFIIGYLSNTRTMEGVIIQPLIGRWSDKSTNPLGRRRPFILFGIPVSVACLVATPLAGHAGHHWALPLVILSIVLFSITWNIAGDPYQALMIDITPVGERAIFNAILSVIALVGQVAILLYASIASIKKNTIPDLIFYVCAAFLLFTYAVVFFGVREPRHAAAQAEVENRIPWRVYVQEMRTFKEALKVLGSIFFLWTGLNAVLPYLTVFTKHVMHVDASHAIRIYLVIVVASALAAYPFGRLGARYGSRRFIVVGTVLMIAAGIGGTVAPTYNWLYPVAILAGVGFSATTALTYPYLSQLVPSSKMGVFTGLQAAFSSVAVPISVGVTGALIELFGYRSIFVMLTAMMVVDIALLLSVDEGAAHRQILASERAEQRIAPQIATTLA
jgi:Na+/melibiose symporter-like transporter